ncbi:MFS transporter [Chroococcidiopsis sp. CCALA 051]|uniref:MFS transporter n=1 Tax=Chroococcidiopsis sp. CCALA 051 TaxID=869949 RepID=UPI000D0E2111|nr:MFS transporter [Chroococcidiopsis sp. CCALA 051]MBE9015355.1 MFS transporter [Chroococcidiopsidales cyanobacterium LEGE 13417]PSM47462.1 MFS transporter [Chroococcidiopsis sp. CCALA 051]
MGDKRVLGKNVKRSHSGKEAVWFGVAIAFYAFVAIAVAEAGLGVLLPSILAAYNLNPATVTLLFISQTGGYVVAAFSSSLISSRLGLARMLLVAAMLLMGALIIYALNPFWWVMVAAGVLLGLGIALIDAGINTFIVDNQRTNHLVGMLHAFYGVGALLGPTIATSLLAFGLNWRSIYLVFAGVVGLLVVAVAIAIVQNYRPMTQKINASGTSAKANLRVALQTPAVLLTGLLLMVYVGAEVCVGNWAYSVQNLSRGIPPIVAGYSISAYWLGVTIGRLSLGYFMRRLGAVRTLDISLVLLSIGLLAWWLVPNLYLSLPLIGFGFAAIYPATIALLPQRISPALIPAAIGFVSSVASLGAASLPSAVGWIASRTSLEIIPVLMMPLALVMVIVHRWLVGTGSREQRSM